MRAGGELATVVTRRERASHSKGTAERSVVAGAGCGHFLRDIIALTLMHMSAEPVTSIDPHEGGSVHCWRCGTIDAPACMVHLGNHPEVRLCVGCAHFVHQEAWEIEDEGKRGTAAVVRHRIRNLRAEVIRRGWHHNRFIGGTLRWLGKHLP